MALVFSSCQRDELESNVVGGEVEISLSAGLPYGLTTYGPSHLGGATNVNQDEYDLRYILEVYDGDNKVYKETTIVPSDFTSSNASFSARLLAKKYKFILWADFVTNGTEDDLYYNTGDLRNIGYTGLVNPAKLSDDAVDAYYKVVDVDLTTGGKKLSGIKLQRPFGKIRFVATDALSDGVSQTETPASVKIDFKGASVPASFNALTGEASGNMTLDEFTFKPVQEDAYINGATKENAYILGYAYLFATEPASAHEVDVTVYSDEAATAQIGVRNLSNIPVAENKLTTVVGNFFSNEGDIDVIVEDEFGNEEVVDVEDLSYPNEGVLNTTTGVTYETIAAAIADAKDDDVLTLAAQQFDELIDINNAVTRAAVTAPATLTIVGQTGSLVNGVSILAGDVTLKNIEFNGTGNYGTVHVANDADVTLQNCTINAPEGTAGRPIETAMTISGSLIIDGCVIYNNGRPDSYLNPAAESGIIQVLNSEFKDGNLAAEYKVDLSAAAYPVIKGNTFSATSYIGVSDVTAQTEAVNLSREVKLFINGMIEENTFADADQVKVVITPLPYDPNNATIDLTEKIPMGPVYNETTGQDYMNLTDAIAAAEDGNILVLAEGSYENNITIPEGKNITIKGDVDHKSIIKGQITVTNAGITAEGIVIENSISNGIYTEGGSSIVANNCIFNVTPNASNNNTAVMTWKWKEANNAKVHLTNCTFNAEGVRTIQLRQVADAKVEGCTFNRPYSYAVQIDEAGTNLTFNNNTVNDAMSGVYVHNGTTESSVEQSENTFNNVSFPFCARPQALNNNTNNLDGFWYYVTASADENNNIAAALKNAKINDFIAMTAGEYTLGTIQDKSVNFIGPNTGISGTASRNPEAILNVRVYQPKTRPGVTLSFDGVKIVQSSSDRPLFDVEGGGADLTVKNSIVEVDGPASQGLLYSNGVRASANISFENNYLKATGTEDVSMWIYGNKAQNAQVDVSIKNNSSWQYWMPQTAYDGDGEYMKISDELGIPTEKGEYEIKITFNGGIITHLINGKEVGSYNLGEKKTKIGTVSLISWGYDQSYKTTWSYPVVRY